MKGKQITVRALQDEINAVLEKYAGSKYEDGGYLKWFKDEVAGVLNRYEIKEMRPHVWDMIMDTKDQGISFGVGDRIARFDVDLKPDKRIKWGPGRGKVNYLSISFRDDILDMTLDQARKFLFEEKRDECIQRLKGICAEAQKQLDEANAGITELMAAQF